MQFPFLGSLLGQKWWKLEKLQNRLFFRGSGCNEGGHSVGRLFGGWIVCEIVQNRRKTSMIRPKAGKFFSGFRRDVWHRGWGKCVSKMGPLDRSGHAVSLFWRVLVKVPEVFYVYTASTSLPQPALSYQNTMTNDFLMHSDATFDTGGGWNVVRKSLPGHAVSLFWSAFVYIFCKAFFLFQFCSLRTSSVPFLWEPALAHQNTMTNDFLMHSDAPFDTSGGEMWFEKAGQAMLLRVSPCLAISCP